MNIYGINNARYLTLYVGLALLLSSVSAFGASPTTASSVSFPPSSNLWKVQKKGGKIVAVNPGLKISKTVFTDVDEETEVGQYDILSQVGPILSVNVSLYWEGGAHPGHLARISTVNLDKDKTPFLLTDIFPEDQILSALLNDKVVKKALRNKKPRNLAELIQVADGGCEISFYSLKEAFAFHHIKGNNVAIRIGLPHGCEAMRGNYTEIGIYLPIPVHLKSLLDQASRRGALMKK